MLAAGALALVLSGCGASAPSATDAYNSMFAMWKSNDGNAACKAMSQGYQHKIMAELQLFGDDCQAAVYAIYKQVTGAAATKNLSVTPVSGPSGTESVVVKARLTDGIVRTRFDFERRGDKLIMVGDRTLDATGPQASIAAYKASQKGRSPEVLWSEGRKDSAKLWEIRGNGSGSYSLVAVKLKRVGGKWAIESTTVLGTVPNIKPRDSAAV